MIQQTGQAFRVGAISKQAYIDQMYEQHRILFEYASLLETVDLRSIEIKKTGVLFTTAKDGIHFFCTDADKRTAPFEILNFGEYESADAALLYRLIHDGDLVFDIGANIGWYSLVLGKKFPSSTIHSFEPLPPTYTRLVENIALNKFTNVFANNFGFSEEAKNLRFYSVPGTSVSNSSRNLEDDPGAIETMCRVITLDSYVFEKKLQPAVIKCDVEGAELMVYRGAMQTLADCKPVVFTEMLRKWSAKFGYHPNEIIRLFEGLGYQCFVNNGNAGLSAISEVTEATTHTNFFFLHPAKHAGFIKDFVERA